MRDTEQLLVRLRSCLNVNYWRTQYIRGNIQSSLPPSYQVQREVMFSLCVTVHHQGGGVAHLHSIILPLVPCPFPPLGVPHPLPDGQEGFAVSRRRTFLFQGMFRYLFVDAVEIIMEIPVCYFELGQLHSRQNNHVPSCFWTKVIHKEACKISVPDIWSENGNCTGFYYCAYGYWCSKTPKVPSLLSLTESMKTWCRTRKENKKDDDKKDDLCLDQVR